MQRNCTEDFVHQQMESTALLALQHSLAAEHTCRAFTVGHGELPLFWRVNFTLR